MGNPPFVGQTYRTDEQNQDVRDVFGNIKRVNSIDYVACWYVKAADYVRANPAIRCAFVSTNSITQGEQVEPIWRTLLDRGVIIHFAHRTFKWESEARGKAHVHVVIIGFGLSDHSPKLIFDYSDEDSLIVHPAKNINPYLVDAPTVVVANRYSPLGSVPEITLGNKPADGGNLILSALEKTELIAKEPEAAHFIHPYLGSEEFINGNPRYCLWLKDASPVDLKRCPSILQRLQKVRDFRLKSTAKPTRNKADTPQLFFFTSQPTSNFLAIPEVSSERRKYIPIGYMEPNTIVSNKLLVCPGATLYHFGILTSAMHMAWMRQVTGRLKSDYQYSSSIVYNTFPWPEKIADGRKAEIERLAQAVLDERARHLEKGATLADLYDPVTMPPGLAKAHAALDRAVDRAYRPAPFETERARVEHLFARYQALTTLFPAKPPKKPRKKQAAGGA